MRLIAPKWKAKMYHWLRGKMFTVKAYLLHHFISEDVIQNVISHTKPDGKMSYPQHHCPDMSA